LQKKEGPTRAAVLLKQFQPTFHRPHRVTAPIRGEEDGFFFCLAFLLSFTFGQLDHQAVVIEVQLRQSRLASSSR
jgi:hypothetical protein